MDHGERHVKQINPRERANIFSIITFFYTWDLFKKSRKKELDQQDIYQIPKGFSSSKLGEKLEKLWNAEKFYSNPTIYKVLFKCFGLTYLSIGVIQLAIKTSMNIYQPRVYGKLMSYFVPNQTGVSQEDAYYYGGLVIALNILSLFYNNNYVQIITEFGIKIRVAVCSLLYRKVLTISPTSLSETTVGKIVTLMTKDAHAFDSSLIFLNDMWIGICQIALLSKMIYDRVGDATFAGLAVFGVAIPIQIYLGKLTANLRIETAKKTDERLQVTQETLSVIKIIKMYTWETYFQKHISNARKHEIAKLKKIYYTKATNMIIAGLTSSLSFYALITTYIYLDNQITAETGFFILSCFANLRGCIMISIPLGVSQGAELIASLSRINKFLLTEEVRQPKVRKSSKKQPRVFLRNVAVKVKDEYILKDISLDARQGLYLISGSVGSGKSSLLKTLLREYSVCQGLIDVEGTISYAPQEPWLFPSSIKQNILFGQKYNKERYERVLKVCALDHDLKQFDDGDQTIVGDRGINLSKGQQARITLARAVYKDSEIYLLDDSLTALDATINNFVFTECIKGFLKNKLCILVTHNANHMKQSNNILVLKNGKSISIEEQEKLLDRRITFYMDETEDVIENSDSEDDYGEDKLLLKDKKFLSVFHETNREGKLNWKTCSSYYRYAGGLVVIVFLLTIFFLSQFTISYTDKLVNNWIDIEQKITTLKTSNLTNSTDLQKVIIHRDNILSIYNVLIIVGTFLLATRALATFTFSLQASKNIHNAMADSVLLSKMEFFDTKFIGNILNRFSKDLGTIDEYIPYLIYENLRLFFFLGGNLFLILTVKAIFIIPILIIFSIFYFVRNIYIPVGRSMKRLDAATRSPMVGYLNSTLEGLTIIRAYETQPDVQNEFDKHQDHFTSSYYMMQCATRAFGFTLDLISSFLSSSIIAYFLLTDNTGTAGSVGLAIGQSIGLTILLQWAIRQIAEFESQLTTIERTEEYIKTKKEDKNGQIITYWPRNGQISYDNVSLSYSKSKEAVLKNLSFTIEPKKKIGIVGRTGAGKSSIIATLFRLYDSEGRILIDGVDTKRLNLDFLRSSIGIIPQDPVLFSGSIRTNIDPINKYSDAELWKAIKKTNLHQTIKSLDYPITECGSNFSSGQRQLMCLARALISKNKIIVLDEATANMDPDTDYMLQQILKENFKECTILTIAHRLNHLLDYDKVMVLDEGKIVEFDDPQELLKNQEGYFYRMVKRAGL